MSAVPDSAVPPIFIVGVPSSGTTLLRDILWSHPWYFSSHETNFFTAPYRSDDWFRMVEQNLLGDLSRRVVIPQELVPEYTMPFITGLAARSPSARLFTEAWFEYVGRRQPGRQWVEKTPRHLLHLEAIRKAFPEAVVLCVSRSPADNVLSLSRRAWFRGGLRGAAGTAAAFLKRYMELEALVDGCIQYEYLCREPEHAVKDLFMRLGIPYAGEDRCFADILSGWDYRYCPVYPPPRPIHTASVGRAAPGSAAAGVMEDALGGVMADPRLKRYLQEPFYSPSGSL